MTASAPRCPRRFAAVGSGLALCAALVACATYAPLPLDRQASLKTRLADLHYAGALPDRLGIEQVALLAVENNPDLRAARAQHGVAQAQIVQAGILPNPSLTASYGALLGGPGILGALAAGLSQDIKALVTLSAKTDAARAAGQQVDASLLWQEWQTIGKARLLTVDLIEGEKARAALADAGRLLAERLARDRKALAQGNAILSSLAPDLAAVGDIRRQLDDVDRQQATRRHELDALLGLTPDIVLPLATSLDLPVIEPSSVQELLPSLADRRPDLVALQLGYRAQEAKMRGAILAQFPALSLGVTGGRDTSDVRTAGPQITMDLPIFDRNQGALSLEQATRQQLHDEFTARLATAKGEVEAMLADQGLVERQIAGLQPELDELGRTIAHAKIAYRSGDLDERSYVDMIGAQAAKQQQAIALEQNLLEQRVAMATLIGAGMPRITLPPQQASR